MNNLRRIKRAILNIVALVIFTFQFTFVPAYADTPSNEDYSVKMTIDVPSEWKVILPTKIKLTKQLGRQYSATFEKVVTGDLAAGERILVEPESTNLSISDSSGGFSSVNGTLIDNKPVFITNDLDIPAQCYVSIPATFTDGEWSGDIHYNISFDVEKPGFYLANGTLFRELSVEDVNNYGALSSHYQKSLPSHLGLTDAEINTITKIVMPEMDAPANCSYMFYKCQNIEEIDVLKFNTENVTNMSYMFNETGYYATTFSVIGLDDWNTENVTNMFYMFYYTGRMATTFDIGDISNWNTENVTDMWSMFYYAGQKASYSLNLSGWNVNKVTSHNYFNSGASSKIIEPAWIN